MYRTATIKKMIPAPRSAGTGPHAHGSEQRLEPMGRCQYLGQVPLSASTGSHPWEQDKQDAIANGAFEVEVTMFVFFTVSNDIQLPIIRDIIFHD
jgi:hypothetical protein